MDHIATQIAQYFLWSVMINAATPAGDRRGAGLYAGTHPARHPRDYPADQQCRRHGPECRGDEPRDFTQNRVGPAFVFTPEFP
jgi:hypothetical protein